MDDLLRPYNPNIVAKPLEALAPYAKNAKIHGEEQIAKLVSSLREFGWTFPILTDEFGEVIAGHGRLLAAQRVMKYGWQIPGWSDTSAAPVLAKPGLSDLQKRAYRILDNRIAEEAGWDNELLSLELEGLSNEQFDLSLTGFDASQIQELSNALYQPTPGLTDEDELKDAPVIPVTKIGDIWVCGNHRVMCGDSTKLHDVERLMDGAKADLIVTDPPYNVNYQGRTSSKLTISNDNLGSDEFYQFLYSAYTAMYAVAKDGAGLYVFHADSEGFSFRKAMVDAGYKLSQCCVWVKNSFVIGRQDYHWQHEPVLYGWKPTGPHKWHGDRKQSTVWSFDRPQRNDIHPTMKPVELIECPINNSSQLGDIVLDPFGGSGSTLIACQKTGRSARLMELDPVYADVIVRRWQDFSGRIATRLNDGAQFNDLVIDSESRK